MAEDKEDEALRSITNEVKGPGDSPRSTRSTHIIRDGMDRARKALEPYVHDLEPDYRAALRNFLVDFLHLVRSAGLGARDLEGLFGEAEILRREEQDVSEVVVFETVFERAEPRPEPDKQDI